MIGITVLLAGAAAAFGLARWLNVPALPLQLLMGVALGAVGVLAPVTQLQDTLVLGVTFLVFVTGIEMSPRRVAGQRLTALKVGGAHFVALLLIGLGMARVLGYRWESAVYLGLALTVSSTLVEVRLLRQRQQSFEPFGRLVIGVLLLQDLLVILLFPVITRLPEGPAAVLAGVLGALLLVALAYVGLRWLAPWLVLRVQNDEEVLLLVVLALLFLFCGLALLLRLPLAAGAFLAGVSLSGFPVSGLVRAQLSSLSDFFQAIFFTGLGALVQSVSGEVLLHALLLGTAVVVLTPLLVVLIAERTGLSARQSIESGLLLAQTSELSLILGLHGLSLGQIDADAFTVIALVTAGTMIVTPFVATDRTTWRLMRLHPARQQPLMDHTPSGHVLLLGCGDVGMPLLETLLGTGHDVLVVDDDPAVIARLREGDVPCIRGDGSDFKVLQTARAREARVIVSTMRRTRDSRNLLRFVRGVPVLVRVFELADARRIRRLGGTPVLYSEAAAEDFFLWLDRAEHVGLSNERRLRPRAT